VQISYTEFYVLAPGRQVALPALFLLSDCTLYRLQMLHERLLLVPSVGTYCKERGILYTICHTKVSVLHQELYVCTNVSLASNLEVTFRGKPTVIPENTLKACSGVAV
jgi:hypothetical protein